MEEIDLILEEAQNLMDKSIQHFTGELVKVRAGKAMPNMLDGLMVEYYGNPTPINQVASINTPDARTLVIKPWEKSVIPEIEKAIINSGLGLNPQNDGELVRINIPPLTEERRQAIVKQVKNEAEQARISIRNVRKEMNVALKKLQKDGVAEDNIKAAEDEVQKITDKSIAKIEDILAVKEKEIMTI